MSAKLEFLEKVFGKGQYSHNTHELGIRCLYCFHHKPKLFINIETQRWHCFVCGKAGRNLFGLLKKAGTNSDIKRYVELFKPKTTLLSTSDSAENKKFTVELPKQYKPLINCLDTVYGKRAMLYLKRRGITEDDVLFYKIGICFDGQLQDRIIFPSFNADGELNFYTTRSIIDGTMNHWSPSVPSDYKQTQIFNELYVDWNRPVVLVEGFVDFIKAQNSIPLMGSNLTAEYKVLQYIVKSEQPVYLAFDEDAFKKTNRIAELFLNYDVDVFVVDVSPFKDVGEMTKEQFLEKFNSAIPFSRELIFKNKLRMIK